MKENYTIFLLSSDHKVGTFIICIYVGIYSETETYGYSSKILFCDYTWHIIVEVTVYFLINEVERPIAMFVKIKPRIPMIWNSYESLEIDLHNNFSGSFSN